MTHTALVVFDLDGTLLDSLKDIAGAMNELLRRHNLPPQPEVSFGFIAGDGARVAVMRATGGRFDDDDAAIDSLTAEYVDIYRASGSPTSAPYPGVIDLLRRLKSIEIQCSVLTNKPHDIATSVVNDRFPPDMLSTVLGVQPGVARKPDPKGLLGILSQTGVEPDAAIYVGDTDTDMCTGLRAQVKTVGCSWGFRPAEELRRSGAHAIIDQPMQLIHHVHFDAPDAVPAQE